MRGSTCLSTVPLFCGSRLSILSPIGIWSGTDSVPRVPFHRGTRVSCDDVGLARLARHGLPPDSSSLLRDETQRFESCCNVDGNRLSVSSPIPTWLSPCHLPTQSQLTRVPRCNGTRNTKSAPTRVAVGLETLSLLPQKRGVVWRQALTRKSRESHVVATHASPTVQRDSRH